MNRRNTLVLKYRLRQALDTILISRPEIMTGFVGNRNRLSEQDQGGQKPTHQWFSIHQHTAMDYKLTKSAVNTALHNFGL